MKKPFSFSFLAFLPLAAFFLILTPAHAQAATLYWDHTNVASDTQWTTLTGNWWNDASATIQAASLPQSGDNTILLGSSSPTVDLDAWTEPDSIDSTGLTGSASTSGVIITGDCGDILSSSYSGNFIQGNATFNSDCSYNDGINLNGYGLGNNVSIGGNVYFNGSSYNKTDSGYVGSATFRDQSFNDGTVWGTATFYDNASNKVIVQGPSYFHDSSLNEGYVGGDATFNDESANGDGITQDGEVIGTAIYSNASSGVLVIPDGGYWDGTAGAYVGADRQPIVTWIFDGGSDNHYNLPGAAIFNATSSNNSTVVGTSTFNDLSSNSYYGTALSDAFFNASSSNQGTVDGNATFDSSTANQGTVIGDATYANVSGGVLVIPDGGSWSGSAASVLDNNGEPITEWIFNGDGNLFGATIPGNAVFNDTSYCAYSGITGNATFNDTSDNSGFGYCTIDGNATFNDQSYNNNTTVDGNAVFAGASYNDGTVNGTSTFAYATGGVINVPNGGQWGNGTSASIAGIDNQPITAWIFNGNSVNNGIVTGNALFNNTSYDSQNGTVTGTSTFAYATGGIITVPDGAQWGGTLGPVLGIDNNPITSWIFDGASINYETIDNNPIFNATSSNQGTVTGNATFNDQSYNNGTVTGTGIFTGAVAGAITIPNGGQWGGSIGSIVDADNNPITTWIFDGDGSNQGVIPGNAVFNDVSLNQGTVNGNAIFNDQSSSQAQGFENATIGGNAVFNGSSFNGYSSNVIGNAVFNDLSYNGSNVSGLATFNDASYNQSTVSDAIFNASSSNEGYVSGTAIFIGTSSVAGGTLTGTNLRLYLSDATTTLNFTANGPWTVIADHAAVDVAGAAYDGSTTFDVANGGSFVPSEPGSVAPTAITDVLATISVAPVSALAQTTATLNAAVTVDGLASSTVLGFNYGPTASYGESTSTTGTFGIEAFSQSLTGLTCGTAYHYDAFAVNGVGTTTSSDQTFTTSACPSAPAVSYGGGGGGGSVSSAVLASLLAPSATTTAYLTTLASSTSSAILCPAGWVCVPDAATAPVSTPAPAVFVRNLSLGSAGPDVKALQQYLNSNGYLIAKSGPGSTGHETTIFGSLTKKALIKFQAAHGIPATGYFGVMTRGYLANH